MIDIHAHLLNNVDDGSRDIVESLNNLKAAAEVGFTDVILTPHYIENYYENNYESIKPKIEELKLQLQDNNIPLKIHQGNEVYISENIGDLAKNNVVASLAKSQYLLFELPLENRIFALDNLIMDIKMAGYVPVLAHPERYKFIQNEPNELVDLISKGVLIQSNYGSIIGQYGKEPNKTIIKMLKNNMVHFLGTDTHRHGYIYENFDNVEKELLKCVSKEKLQELTTSNADKILRNEHIEIEAPSVIKKRFFFG